jgi:hypothetical protein
MPETILDLLVLASDDGGALAGNRSSRANRCGNHAGSTGASEEVLVIWSLVKVTALAGDVTALLYTSTLLAAAWIAILAPTRTRRAAARDVVRLLLRRHQK